MAEPEQLAASMQQAYARGDHREARRLARALGATQPGPELAAAASALLELTRPDGFLMWIGALGLGVVVWLVYAYVL